MMVNATMVVPFVFRLLLPEARALHTDYDRLCLSLGLPALTRLRLVTLPRLARPLGFGAGLAAALSMGDLGVIALFAGERSVTLPLMVQQLMGARCKLRQGRPCFWWGSVLRCSGVWIELEVELLTLDQVARFGRTNFRFLPIGLIR